MKGCKPWKAVNRCLCYYADSEKPQLTDRRYHLQCASVKFKQFASSYRCWAPFIEYHWGTIVPKFLTNPISPGFRIYFFPSSSTVLLCSFAMWHVCKSHGSLETWCLAKIWSGPYGTWAVKCCLTRFILVRCNDYDVKLFVITFIITPSFHSLRISLLPCSPITER